MSVTPRTQPMTMIRIPNTTSTEYVIRAQLRPRATARINNARRTAATKDMIVSDTIGGCGSRAATERLKIMKATLLNQRNHINRVASVTLGGIVSGICNLTVELSAARAAV